MTGGLPGNPGRGQEQALSESKGRISGRGAGVKKLDFAGTLRDNKTKWKKFRITRLSNDIVLIEGGCTAAFMFLPAFGGKSI